MWTAVALTTVLSLAPAQKELELKNVRTTYGILGEARKEDKFVPGDVVVLSFDVEGLKVAADGGIQYAMGLEMIKKGKTKPEFKTEPKDLEGENSLGGTTLPVFAVSQIPADSSPGEYSLRVTIRDVSGKAEKVLNHPFEVVAAKLGFVQVHLTDINGVPVPPVAVPGQRVFVHCALAGFKLDKGKLPNVTYEMAIKDAEGTPTIKKPYKANIKAGVKDLMVFRPRQLDLNRPGKYKVVMSAKDNVSGETAEQTLNLNVVDFGK